MLSVLKIHTVFCDIRSMICISSTTIFHCAPFEYHFFCINIYNIYAQWSRIIVLYTCYFHCTCNNVMIVTYSILCTVTMYYLHSHFVAHLQCSHFNTTVLLIARAYYLYYTQYFVHMRGVTVSMTQYFVQSDTKLRCNSLIVLSYTTWHKYHRCICKYL